MASPAEEIANPQEEFHKLKVKFDQLRVEFLRTALDFSYTVATLTDGKPNHGPFREKCHQTASKGYSVVVRMLAKDPGTDVNQALEPHVAHLRAALGGDASELHPPGNARAVVAGAQSKTEPPFERLTHRELEVLRYIAEGHGTKQVAGILGIAFKTAACHRQNIMDKLGMHETASLVRYAIRQRMIQP